MSSLHFSALTSVSRAVPLAVVALAGALAAAGSTAGCRPRFASGEFDSVSCSNGIDDDSDFMTDCDDPGCLPFCGGPGTDAGPGVDGGGGAVCGDQVVSGDEDCEGTDLNGESCVSLGFAGGSLVCTGGCLFNTVSCTGVGTCGDDSCDAGDGETCSSCPVDCGSCCGNGSCSGGETCSSCATDCGSCGGACGDGTCGGTETCTTCAVDCGSCCGNGVCSGGETCSSCASDCGSCCGNGVCSGGETCSTCASDCGSCCGNGICSGAETCSSCSLDCGPCGPVCGDFFCDSFGGETCSSCSTDCGSCGGSCTYDWDGGTLGGWTATDNCTSVSTGWTADSFRSFSPSYSLWYGNPSTRTYACSGASNSGTVTSPFITLNAGSPGVSFELWLATEGSSSYDELTLYVVYAGSPTAVWDSGSGLVPAATTSGVWVYEFVSLAAWAGLPIQLRWGFDTIDSAANDYEGAYIDGMFIDGSC